MNVFKGGIMNFCSKSLISLIFISLIISLPVVAQIDYSEKLQFNPDVTIGELDNGLKYYIKENKKPEIELYFGLL